MKLEHKNAPDPVQVKVWQRQQFLTNKKHHEEKIKEAASDAPEREGRKIEGGEEEPHKEEKQEEEEEEEEEQEEQEEQEVEEPYEEEEKEEEEEQDQDQEGEELATIPDTEEYQKDTHNCDLAALGQSISLLIDEVIELRSVTRLRLDAIHGLLTGTLKRKESPVVPEAPNSKRRDNKDTKLNTTPGRE